MHFTSKDWILYEPPQRRTSARRSPSRSRRTAVPLRLELAPAAGEDWEPGGSILFFQDDFRGALVESGMDRSYANALSGALIELASNAIEHSASLVSPLACFEVSTNFWCFGVADVGRGVLASIRENPSYAGLRTSAEALSTVLRDGVSRTGQPGRGDGFRRVFKALVDRRATIRFRSEGAAGWWEGESPTAQTITLKSLPVSRRGFYIRISGPLRRTA